MSITVKQRFIHMTARKLRRVAGVIRGQEAKQAVNQLNVLPLAAAKPMAHAVQSALAAVKDKNNNELYIISVLTVDEGPAMKRRILKSRGRATRMEHRMSHITVSLTPVEQKTLESKKEKRRGA